MNPNATRSWVVQELADALQAALQAMTSLHPRISWQRLDGIASEDTPEVESIWWAQAFTGLPSPSVWLGATVPTVNTLGKAVLSASGMQDTSPEDARSACHELFAQAANSVAEKLSEHFTKPVKSDGVTTANAPQGTLAATLAVELPALRDAVVLTMRCHPDFLARLGEVLAPSSTPTVAPAERIRDLELPVHAILGRTVVPLRDVFKLMVGSVIGIGKTVTDPVDLMVNDHVVARGQVVICKGSYGVKLTSQLSGAGDDACRITN